MQLCNPQNRGERRWLWTRHNTAFPQCFMLRSSFMSRQISCTLLQKMWFKWFPILNQELKGSKSFVYSENVFLFEVDNDISGRCKENVPDKTAAHFRKPPEKEQLEIGRVKTSQSDQFLPWTLHFAKWSDLQIYHWGDLNQSQTWCWHHKEREPKKVIQLGKISNIAL